MNYSSPQKSAFDQISEIAGEKALDFESFVLPANIITKFERDGIKPQEIEKIIGPRDELIRSIDENANLTPDQTDRAARLANIVRMAEHIFGKREKAFLWLRCPNAELDNKRPLDCIVRESAARAVEEALIRIDHGIAA